MYTYESIHEPKQFTYDVAQRVTPHLIEYSFISKGERDILKMVHYSFLKEVNGRQLFNFGFGDYDFPNGGIADNAVSNNGDTYKVFNTVLSTVPRFFEIHNNAILSVQGSDSGPGFAETCRVTCRKSCTLICKNTDRRIKIYRAYVNKHYETLKKDYTIYGSVDVMDDAFSMTAYEPGDKQKSIVLMKNKNAYSMKAEENQTQEVMEPTTEEEMWALYYKQREASNWSDLFAESNARARAWIDGLILKDKQRQQQKRDQGVSQ